MKPLHVLFVCLGNICRSPLAEGAARRLAVQRHLRERFLFDSAATASYHVGEDYDPRVAAVLEKYDAVFDHRVRQVGSADFYEYDWILGMDQENMRDLRRLQPAGSPAKLALVSEPWGEAAVTDPYYQDDWACEQTYLELSDLLERWLPRWLEEA